MSKYNNANTYQGNTYKDERGRTYTDYGALVRGDGYHYPEGARISPNGMYFDTGNGWQDAKMAAVEGGGYSQRPTLGYGMAPGTVFAEFKVQQGDDAPSAPQNIIEKNLETEAQQAARTRWEEDFAQEVKKYTDARLRGYFL